MEDYILNYARENMKCKSGECGRILKELFLQGIKMILFNDEEEEE